MAHLKDLIYEAGKQEPISGIRVFFNGDDFEAAKPQHQKYGCKVFEGPDNSYIAFNLETGEFNRLDFNPTQHVARYDLSNKEMLTQSAKPITDIYHIGRAQDWTTALEYAVRPSDF